MTSSLKSSVGGGDTEKVAIRNSLDGSLEYQLWMTYFKDWSNNVLPEGADAMSRERYRFILWQKAVHQLKKALEIAERDADRERKFFILLTLARLHTAREFTTGDKKYDASMEKLREMYFFDAVKISTVLNENGSHFPEMLVSTYLSDIDPAYGLDDNALSAQYLRKTVWKMLVSEQGVRARWVQKEVERFVKEVSKSSAFGNFRSDQVMSKLVSLLGPFRLLVMTEGKEFINYGAKSLTGITEHGFKEREIRHIIKQANSTSEFFIETVNPLNIHKCYRVFLDKGEGSVSEFDPEILEMIVKPLVKLLIQVSEKDNYPRHGAHLNELERKIHLPKNRNDYSEFVEHAVRDMDSGELNGFEPSEFARVFAKAVDVCRFFLTNYRKLNNKKLLELSVGEIDRFLWGMVDTEVLVMAKSMLLSCDETMVGSGYPFHLSKENIPLEGRLFSIIRAYELKSFESHPRQALGEMRWWMEKDRYFDSEIFAKFQSYQSKGFKKLPPLPATKVSEYRKKRYLSEISSWPKLIEKKEYIDMNTYKAKLLEGTNEEKQCVKNAKEWRVDLCKLANMVKIILIVRHGKTPSDEEEGKMGDDSEPLSRNGEESSLAKWSFLWALDISNIFSSNFVRALSTAKLIRQGMSEYVSRLVSSSEWGMTAKVATQCARIISEFSMRNPDRSIPTEDTWTLQQLMTSSYARGFLLKYLFSPSESTNLFVTHLQSGRNFMNMLVNFFRENFGILQKYSISHDSVYALVFRGTKVERAEVVCLDKGLSQKKKNAIVKQELNKFEEALREFDENGNLIVRKRSLLFSFSNWKEELDSINELSFATFWHPFYELRWKMNFIRLHYRLIKFIDLKMEEDSAKTKEFIDGLSRINGLPSSARIWEMLEVEWSKTPASHQ